MCNLFYKNTGNIAITTHETDEKAILPFNTKYITYNSYIFCCVIDSKIIGALPYNSGQILINALSCLVSVAYIVKIRLIL